MQSDKSYGISKEKPHPNVNCFVSVLDERVQLVSDQQFCGGKLTKSQGEIKTPNWPEKKYPPGTSCSWLITVEPDMVGCLLAASMQAFSPPKSCRVNTQNTRQSFNVMMFLFVYQAIQVKFDKFLLEADIYCRFDYVAFFNGGEKDNSRLIGKYCGDQAPE